MRTIYKYPLDIKYHQTIECLWPANVLSVKMQNGQLNAWVEVDTDCIPPRFYPRNREFLIFGTGQYLNTEEQMKDWTFFDTIIEGSFVWHIYMKKYHDER